MKVFLLIAAILLQAIKTAPQEDLVESLPGVNIEKMVIYSGYLAVNNTGRFIHYVFVQSKSEPTTAPVTLWMNGGPGCSSMEGMFSEIGPFVFLKDNSTTLEANPYTYSNVSNLLFFETPTLVGFSINPQGINGTYSDDTTAEDNYAALLDFFNNKFPEFKSNEFWIAGESYAGIYIPTLAQRIHQRKDENRFNLQGLLIGNGAHQMQSILESNMEFLLERNLIPPSLRSQYDLSCKQQITSNLCYGFESEINKITQFINPYDIYGYCFYEYPIELQVQQFQSRLKFFYEFTSTKKKYNHDLRIPCTYLHNMDKYLNSDEVKKALNVQVNVTWSLCVFDKKFQYSWNTEGSVPALKELLGQYDILFYSGDADSVVSYLDTLKLLDKLKVTKTQEKYRPYIPTTNPNDLGGFTQSYNEKVVYATVRGAGHMVPGQKRKEAFYLFNQTINRQKL